MQKSTLITLEKIECEWLQVVFLATEIMEQPVTSTFLGSICGDVKALRDFESQFKSHYQKNNEVMDDGKIMVGRQTLFANKSEVQNVFSRLGRYTIMNDMYYGKVLSGLRALLASGVVNGVVGKQNFVDVMGCR